jgi:hypothetical protein
MLDLDTRRRAALDASPPRRVVSSPHNAPVAQLDRVSASEEVKQRFETGGKDFEIRDFQKATYPHIDRSDQRVTKSRSAGQKGYCYNLKMRP